MCEYFLAVDIGASSGRHILGWMEQGLLKLEEIHRFKNGFAERGKESCWDTEGLFNEIKKGMVKCREAGKIPVSMGIDTWGVDFVLLDENDRKIGSSVSYRDKRTEHMDEKVYGHISEEELYRRTGIQKQIFNTIYQLQAVKENHPEYFERSNSLLLIPDYFNFLLTGRKATEYTNASTTQLINPETCEWDYELLELLGFPKKIFQKIHQPGTVLGSLSDEIAAEVGFSCDVTLPATHDTGSAVMAVPSSEEDFIYISSGTWSLMGTELKSPDCSHYSRQHNFTNEGGFNHTIRYLKNIMGLWMIQSLRAELDNSYSFAELCCMAEGEKILSIVDCNDARFLAPASMMEAVREFCAETGQQEPETPAQYAKVIYASLAKCYGKTIKEIEGTSGIAYPCIHVIGGGSNADYLNRLTAIECGRTVYAGPTEATAVGNLLAQLLAHGKLESISQARRCVYESFPIKRYEA